jgi:membrane protease YdiL (CAAX protease family)
VNLQPLDHLLTAALVLLVPTWGALEFRRFEVTMTTGREGARLDAYRRAMILEWLLALGVLVLWRTEGRDFARLGLDLRPGPGFWLGGGLAVLACLYLVGQLIVVTRSRARLREVTRQIESVRIMIPRSAREARAFDALSITAGVCEELLYRGFLMAYFGALFGTWAAVGLSTAAFALGHVYQGRAGVGKTGAVGLVMAGLVVLTGSLWAPMLLHAVIDLTSGHLGRRALLAEAEEAASAWEPGGPGAPSEPGGPDGPVPPEREVEEEPRSDGSGPATPER